VKKTFGICTVRIATSMSTTGRIAATREISLRVLTGRDLRPNTVQRATSRSP
jgi:hypothetical protein